VDEKQAVVANGAIAAVNEATRLARKTTSNDSTFFGLIGSSGGNVPALTSEGNFFNTKGRRVKGSKKRKKTKPLIHFDPLTLCAEKLLSTFGVL